MEKLEVRFLKKSLCWTDRVRGVRDYNVVRCFVRGKELETVTNEDPDTRGI